VSVRLGYNTNGFAHHRLPDALDLLAGIGYSAVALTLDVHHAPPSGTDFERLGRELAARGLLPVVETGARFLLDPARKHHPSLLSDSGRERRLDFLLRCVEAAAALGAPCVSLWSGRAEGGDPWVRLVDGLAPVCDAAARAGVDVGFEPEPGMFVETVAQAEELLRRLPHPRLRLTLDVGHLGCLEPEMPEAYVARHAGRLVNLHLDDHRMGRHEHLMFGEGELDFPPLCAAIRAAAAGRDLPATVELSRHSHDAAETARRAFAYLAPLLG